jgi:hypothetical protein
MKGTLNMAKKQLAAVPMEDLLRELEKRKEQLTGLQRRRARLATDLEKLDREIAALAGLGRTGKVRQRASAPAKARPNRRAKNKMGLADAVASVMKESRDPMSAAEAAAAVKKAGYKSKSAGFEHIVAQTLGKDRKKLFKRVSRGRYTLA